MTGFTRTTHDTDTQQVLVYDRDSSTGRLSSASSQSVIDGVSFTEGRVAAFFLSADTLFVSIAGTASLGGGIGLYSMKVRALASLWSRAACTGCVCDLIKQKPKGVSCFVV